MNYQWHYDKLIETRKLLSRKKKDGNYYELHHIIPTSMGGKNDNENTILLTAREHFLAHWLLWRIHRNKEMACAFRYMVICGKFTTSARAYAESVEAYWKSMSNKEIFIKQSNASKKRWEKMNANERALAQSIQSKKIWDKSKEEKSELARKIWATRRANGTQHRRKGLTISPEGRESMRKHAQERKINKQD